jgi:hypothetical protein
METMTGLVREIDEIYAEFSKKPFEYSSKETITEHRRLTEVFAGLLRLARFQMLQALAAFRKGEVEFVLDPAIVGLRDKLKEESMGTSVVAQFLDKFHKGGELQDSID